jgi:diacylglycerol kinase family enzyme
VARRVDIGRVEYRDRAGGDAVRYFANVGSVGMSGAVAARANDMSKRLGGRVTFFYALAREFAVWRNTEVTVTLDGGDERRGRMHDVLVANGEWHAGGMRVAPGAQPDDGLFQVILIGDVTKLDFLTTSPRLYSGKYVSHRRIEMLTSATVAIASGEPLPLELEGEPIGTTPARFAVVPQALRVRVPR